MTLPLSAFRVVSLTVPLLSREGIERLLPFNLAKVVDRPISDFIYDWQIARILKDSQELTVFLYPRAAFADISRDLNACRKQIIAFEADVFSACSYLEAIGEVEANRALLCVLIWEHSVSIAVYEAEQVVMVRSLDLEGIRSNVAVGYQAEGLENAPDGEEEHEDERLHGVLDSFFTLDEESSSASVAQSVSPGQNKVDPPANVSSSESESELALAVSPGSIQRMALEIMRTVDFHSAIRKGRPFTRFFVGGEPEVVAALSQELSGNLQVEIRNFPPREFNADCPALLAALSVGALRR